MNEACSTYRVTFRPADVVCDASYEHELQITVATTRVILDITRATPFQRPRTTFNARASPSENQVQKTPIIP